MVILAEGSSKNGSLEIPNPFHSERYEILQKMGKGQSGPLFFAKDHLTSNTVTIRILPWKISPTHPRRDLQLSLKHYLRLNHPNLSKCLDMGIIQESKKIFIVNEYVTGNSFLKLAKEVHYITLFSLLVQLCKALKYLHYLGIPHLNLKPENIIVEKGNQNLANSNMENPGTIKVLDSGLNLLISRYSKKGKKNKASKRPFLNSLIPDHRTDFYSIGLLLYEAIYSEPFNPTNIKDQDYQPPPNHYPLQINECPEIFLQILPGFYHKIRTTDSRVQKNY